MDNGDPSCSTFNLLQCSPTTDANVRLRQGQKIIARAYNARFGEGFPAPLLYRWKHGSRASNYIKEGFSANDCDCLVNMPGTDGGPLKMLARILAAAAAAAAAESTFNENGDECCVILTPLISSQVAQTLSI